MNRSRGTPALQPESGHPVASYEDLHAQQVERAGSERPAAFRLRAQLLDRGRTDTVLAASKGLTVRLKVYASGGENALHAHRDEDHVFILLQGAADFHDADGLLARLRSHEGLLVPKGSFYRFDSVAAEPLVMLRIGSPNESISGQEGRVDIAGEFAHGEAPENRTEPVVFRDGAFFG